MSKQKRTSGLTVMLLVVTLSVTTLAHGNSERRMVRSTDSIPSDSGLSALLQGRIITTASLSESDTIPFTPQFPARSNAPLALTGNVAFETDRAGTFDVYAQDADGSTVAVPLVVSLGADFTPVWSPDGTQMLFASDRDGDSEIFIRSAGGEELQLTHNTAEDAHPAWSPGGNRVIFTSNRGGDYFQIFTMNPDGSDVQQVGVVPGNNAMHPHYAPDGSRITYMRASVTEALCQWNWDVWVMDADGSNQERVTTRLNADLYPNWTPDGTEIVYASCDNWIDFDLYAVNPDTGAERQLTSWLWDNEWGAVYSPDGDYLAFNTDVDGNTEIYVAPAAGGTAFNLTQNNADDLAASWASQAAPETYSISGHVRDDASNPIPGVTISDDKGHTMLTNIEGEYTLSGLASGNYILTPSKIGYQFVPDTLAVSVPPSATDQTFTGFAVMTPIPQPIILVHGWQAMGDWRHSEEPTLWNENVETTFGGMPEWLTAAGYEVWVAHLDTGKLGTPIAEENARWLDKQVAYVKRERGLDVILIGHSMGGLVSRACVGQFADCRENVTAIYTLGSPHAGHNTIFLLKTMGLIATPKTAIATLAFCVYHDLLCQISVENMALIFNPTNPNQNSIDYHFIGGTKSSSLSGTIVKVLDGPNDGAIGASSAVGWYYPTNISIPGSTPGRYWTNETHSAGIWLGYPSYVKTEDGSETESFFCIDSLIETNNQWVPGAKCQQASLSANRVTATDDPTLTDVTASLSGYLESGQIISHTLQVDTSSHSLFYLSWLTGTFSLTLTQPGGQVITPEYAALHPDEVAYVAGAGDSSILPAAAYAFTTTLPGTYTLNIGAGEADSNYVAFVAVETGRTFAVTASAYLYQPGATAILTGTLQGPSGGIDGTHVQAQLIRADDLTETLEFVGLGGGMYRATYIAPDAPGYLQAVVTAGGDDDGTPFTRQVDRLLAVAPHSAQLADSYRDWPKDKDGDGFHDTLALDIGVAVTQVGTYTLSADLVTEGQTVTHAGQYTNLTLGTHTVTLRFDGWDIRRSRLSGPYTVTNVYLVDVGVGGIPAQIAEDVWTTAAYDWRDFGFDNQYLPLVLKNH
jgi:Tol biopolymer transport system component/pimeloyl-ACP methyl ester carboxylesterase